ncbi:MAG: amidohydrolase family protein [Kiritimatiellae bacterium]|nr:amidohydrolase family protein [Kiritimatiellia bacterium]
MPKINAHAHACFNRHASLDEIAREVRNSAVDYFVVAALDLKLHVGKTAEQAAANPNPYARHFYDFEADSNENVAALRDGTGGKVLPFAYADPRESDALEKVRYWVRERDFKGVKLYPPIGFYPDDAAYLAFFRGVEALGVPILVHCGRVLPHPALRMKYANPVCLEGVAVNCPSLKIIVGHFGRPWTYEAYCLAIGFQNVCIDLTTGGSEDRVMIRRAIATLGANRLVFGTDHTGGADSVFEQTRRAFAQDGIGEADLDMIFGGTAAQLLGLP